MRATLAVDGAGVLVVALVVVLLAGFVIAGRRILLDRGGGTVECGLRRPSGDGSWPTWRLGVARYGRNDLSWHHIFGVRLRPDEILARSGLTVVSRRRPAPSEITSLGADTVIVQCRTDGIVARPVQARPQVAAASGAGVLELAMGEAAMTGFLAWLEAAPRDPYRRGLADPGSYLLLPGFHSTSPRSPFARRARMNSRSERRFK